MWEECKKVGIFFFCCIFENGWGNPAKTSCSAKRTAGVVRKGSTVAMFTQQELTLNCEKKFVDSGYFTWHWFYDILNVQYLKFASNLGVTCTTFDQPFRLWFVFLKIFFVFTKGSSLYSLSHDVKRSNWTKSQTSIWSCIKSKRWAYFPQVLKNPAHHVLSCNMVPRSRTCCMP